MDSKNINLRITSQALKMNIIENKTNRKELPSFPGRRRHEFPSRKQRRAKDVGS